MSGNRTNLDLRMWGGLLNGIAILLFLATTAYAIVPSRAKDVYEKAS